MATISLLSTAPVAGPSLFDDSWSDIATAPRNGTWIDLGFVNGQYVRAPRLARSSGAGDAPGIWRFSDCSALRFEDERVGLADGEPSRWRWRAIDPSRNDQIQRDYEHYRFDR